MKRLVDRLRNVKPSYSAKPAWSKGVDVQPKVTNDDEEEEKDDFEEEYSPINVPPIMQSSPPLKDQNIDQSYYPEYPATPHQQYAPKLHPSDYIGQTSRWITNGTQRLTNTEKNSIITKLYGDDSTLDLGEKNLLFALVLRLEKLSVKILEEQKCPEHLIEEQINDLTVMVMKLPEFYSAVPALYKLGLAIFMTKGLKTTKLDENRLARVHYHVNQLLMNFHIDGANTVDLEAVQKIGGQLYRKALKSWEKLRNQWTYYRFCIYCPFVFERPLEPQDEYKPHFAILSAECRSLFDQRVSNELAFELLWEFLGIKETKTVYEEIIWDYIVYLYRKMDYIAQETSDVKYSTNSDRLQHTITIMKHPGTDREKSAMKLAEIVFWCCFEIYKWSLGAIREKYGEVKIWANVCQKGAQELLKSYLEAANKNFHKDSLTRKLTTLFNNQRQFASFATHHDLRMQRMQSNFPHPDVLPQFLQDSMERNKNSSDAAIDFKCAFFEKQEEKELLKGLTLARKDHDFAEQNERGRYGMITYQFWETPKVPGYKRAEEKQGIYAYDESQSQEFIKYLTSLSLKDVTELYIKERRLYQEYLEEINYVEDVEANDKTPNESAFDSRISFSDS